MKAKLLALTVLCFSLVAVAPAQDKIDPAAKKSDEILSKLKQVTLIEYVVPLLLNKDQYKKLLTSLEKSRQRAIDMQRDEAKTLLALEKEYDPILNSGIKDAKIPSQESTKKIEQTILEFRQKRLGVMAKNIMEMFTMLSKELNAGQIKSAANSLPLKMYPPGIKLEEIDQDSKFRFFIESVFFDPDCYSLLVQLEKLAPKE